MRNTLYCLLCLLLLVPVTAAQEHGASQHGLVHDQEDAGETIWTCSMHPQIRLPEPGQCPICGMDLIPITDAEFDADAPVSLKLSETAEKLAAIEVTPVTRQAVEKEIRMFGMLDYDETRLTHITAWVPGRVDRMFVDYTGIRVQEGDHMIELYSPELISAQEELIQASRALTRIAGSGSSLVKRSTEQARQAAREKLRLLGLTEKQVATLEERGTAQDRVTIYAPTGGIVVEKNATEGMYVQTGTRVYTIADLNTLWLHLDAYESDLPWLRYGQEVEFTTRAVPGKRFRGSISFISPVLNLETRTTRVRVNVENDEGTLKPGLFVNGIVTARVYGAGKVIDTSLRGKFIGPMHPEIIQDEPGTCPVCGMDLVPAEQLGYITNTAEVVKPLVIPVSAPLLTGQRAVVYVKDPERSVYELREVILGPRAGDLYIVEEGLHEGELVVSNGAFKIDADLQIRGRPSMMNPENLDAVSSDIQPVADPEGPTGHVHETESTAGNEPTAAVQLSQLLAVYLDLGKALADDEEAVSLALGEKLRKEAPESGSAALSAVASRVEAPNDLPALRKNFAAFSAALIQELKTTPLPETYPDDLFVAHCPMAADGSGASWIQTGRSIQNPYFGAAMYSCGSIQEELS